MKRKLEAIDQHGQTTTPNKRQTCEQHGDAEQFGDAEYYWDHQQYWDDHNWDDQNYWDDQQYWIDPMWQTCACPQCQPRIHEKVIHPADRRPFKLLRGLTWRGHDAWTIASHAVDSFTGPFRRQWINEQWTAWAKKYHLFGSRQAAADSLTDQALNEVVEIFSEIFFLGQLPFSKIYALWDDLDKNQLGYLQPESHHKDLMTLRLNRNHLLLRNCPQKILCVVLHELAHAFFDYYACYPQVKAQCAQSNCVNLYHLNIGATGHGRAWQYLVHHIERSMRGILGFQGELGRKTGMCAELEAGCCIPCGWDVKKLYQWSHLRWWDATIRTKDDDTVLQRYLSGIEPRSTASNSSRPRQRRRNSI